eukprot:CAMPEP_0119056298 /NCGR_PEP_ID=MMETSP1178-20130426/993_1 /TAXON_ID=33656 /ORGANISM="unid sp, Strain CCMP2000" /LENGTH=208 /DNA_ID=CAMNT_0007037019 /DNA_START=174 /DNA_END=800 /DNA_ORIENTATION=+
MAIRTTSPREMQTDYEGDPKPAFRSGLSRIRSGLSHLHHRVVANALARIGLRRWVKSAAITDAILTAEVHGAKLRAPTKAAIRNLAEVNWEETQLPPIPAPAARRSLSELSWEDRCLPPLTAQIPGRLSEVSWEDRVLPTLVPMKNRKSNLAEDELSWEDRCLPPLSTDSCGGHLSELSWEERLLPTPVPAKLLQSELAEDDWRTGGG